MLEDQTADMDRTDISRRVMHRVALINTLAAALGLAVSLAFFLYHVVTNTMRHGQSLPDEECGGDCEYGAIDFERDMIHDWILYPILICLFLLLFITNHALHSALRHDEIKVHRLGTYKSFMGFLRGKYTKMFLFGRHHAGDAKLEGSSAAAGTGAPIGAASATGAPVEVVTTTSAPATRAATGAPTTVVETTGTPTTVVETSAPPAPVIKSV